MGLQGEQGSQGEIGPQGQAGPSGRKKVKNSSGALLGDLVSFEEGRYVTYTDSAGALWKYDCRGGPAEAGGWFEDVIYYSMSGCTGERYVKSTVAGLIVPDGTAAFRTMSSFTTVTVSSWRQPGSCNGFPFTSTFIALEPNGAMPIAPAGPISFE